MPEAKERRKMDVMNTKQRKKLKKGKAIITLIINMQGFKFREACVNLF